MPIPPRVPAVLTIFSAELLIHSYFNIVKREMIDMGPKAILLTLVNHSKESLHRKLLQELYKPNVLLAAGEQTGRLSPEGGRQYGWAT